MHAALPACFERAQRFAAGKSWRLYQAQNFVVLDRGMRLPVACGIGLDMVGEPRHDLMDLVEWVYGSRRGTFVDIGANIGRVMVSLARFDRSIPYIGFDPLPSCARHISEIIRENGLSHTHSILPVGLSDRAGVATIYSNGDTDVSATINMEMRSTFKYSHRTQIAVGIGDDYLADVPEIAIIKIDAEGAELGVLRGLEQTIQKHRPVICFEVLPIVELSRGNAQQQALAVARKQHAAEIVSLLASAGYAVQRFRDGKLENTDVFASNRTDYDFVAVSG